MDKKDGNFEDLITDFHLDDLTVPNSVRDQFYDYESESDSDEPVKEYFPKESMNNAESDAVKEDPFTDDFLPPPPEDYDDAVEEQFGFNVETKIEDDYQKTYQEKEPQKEKPAKEEKPRRKKKKYNSKLGGLWATLWLICTLAIAGWLAIYGINSINDLIGLNKVSREITVTIPEGAPLNEISGILKEAGVIDEAFTFELYAKVKHKENSFAAGTYTLNSDLGYDQIFITLSASNAKREVVTITTIEGMTASEMGALLEEKGVCKAKDFLEVVDTASFGYDFEEMLGKDDLIYHKWEGYLFPDTYEFYIKDDPTAVVRKMVANFNTRVESKYYDRMKEMGLTLEDTITLASIIQAEAGVKSAMETISSVFHNRMNDPYSFPNLESDVTYFYYRDEIKGDPKITSQDRQNAYHEAYDTYYCLGLSVGPVSNPGLDAIDAALYPDDTNYYFFVTDDNGEFYFSRTVDEHEQYVSYTKIVNAELARQRKEEEAQTP